MDNLVYLGIVPKTKTLTRAPAAGDRIRWDGDICNPARTGTVIERDGANMQVEWDCENPEATGANRKTWVPVAILTSPRWDYAEPGQVIKLPEPEPPRTVPGGPSDLGRPYNYFVGEKYDRSLDVADIAKRIRADIKAAMKAGDLPAELKTSVRIDRYRGGQSINIYIKSAPFLVLNPDWIRADNKNEDTRGLDYLTPAAAGARDRIKAIGEAYNYDRSDSMTDYFDSNFCLFVEFDWRMRDRQRDAILAIPENITIKPKEIA